MESYFSFHGVPDLLRQWLRKQWMTYCRKKGVGKFMHQDCFQNPGGSIDYRPLPHVKLDTIWSAGLRRRWLFTIGHGFRDYNDGLRIVRSPVFPYLQRDFGNVRPWACIKCGKYMIDCSFHPFDSLARIH